MRKERSWQSLPSIVHETFFSRRFGFSLEDGTDAYSGCVAFGLERWALALAVTLGPNEAFRLVR